MKKFLAGLFAVLLVCSTLSTATFANEPENSEDSGISVYSDLERPDDSDPYSKD